jgi:hypothetical protein
MTQEHSQIELTITFRAYVHADHFGGCLIHAAFRRNTLQSFAMYGDRMLTASMHWPNANSGT